MASSNHQSAVVAIVITLLPFGGVMDPKILCPITMRLRYNDVDGIHGDAPHYFMCPGISSAEITILILLAMAKGVPVIRPRNHENKLHTDSAFGHRTNVTGWRHLEAEC